MAFSLQSSSRLSLPDRFSARFLLASLIFAFALAGCVKTYPAYRTGPDWAVKRKSVRTIEILPGTIEMYQISAGSHREKMDEWGRLAKNNVVSAIATQLQENHKLNVKIFSEDGLSKESRANLKETRALFEAVNTSIITYTYGNADVPPAFPEKITNFDYSLGKEINALNTEKADAILMVWAIDQQTTAGETAQQVIGMLLGVNLFFPTFMSMALIDPDTGSILWYQYKRSSNGRSGYDLREAENAASVVEMLLEDFPGESNDAAAK